MKKYLVTETNLTRYMKLGDVVDAKELPPGARVLTREQVETALNNGDPWCYGELDNRAFLDELFGETNTEEKG